MYRILYDDDYIFDPIEEAEVVTDATLTNNINAAAYLDFTISPKHPLYNVLQERAGTVRVYFDQEKLFEGEIYKIEEDFYGYRTISCSSALDYLKDTTVRPYHTATADDGNTSLGDRIPDTIDGYFQWLIDQHNTHMLDSNRTFEVGINQGAVFKNSNLINVSSSSYPSTADEIQNNILDAYGGYLVLRYEGERRVLDLYADVHESNAQVIDFGVNLLDFTKTTETSDQYTALILHGGTPEFLDGGFESGTFTNWPVHGGAITTGTVHSGTYSSYFTQGNGEYINDSVFYVRKGFRYKSTVWVKNERSSAVKIYPRFQRDNAGSWTTVSVSGVDTMDIPNDGEWHEYTFDFLPGLDEGTKIRARWVFDTVTNDGNKRVYVDDFDFRRIQGDNELEEDPISVEQLPDGTTEYDSDVVKKGDVIYSTSYVDRYGYRETTYSDEGITDADKLLEAGVTQLRKLMAPTLSIDVKAVDLALYMEGYTHLQVGQAVRIRSLPHGIDEYLMVSSIDLNLQDPGQTSYELGTSYDTLTGQQSGFLRSLNSGINSSLDAVASLDQTTKDQAIQIGSVSDMANSAQQAADNAQNSANHAQQAANDAQNAANSAQQAAEDAMDKANENADAISEEERKRLELQAKTEEMIENVNAFKQQTNQSFETVNAAVGTIAQQANEVSERAEEIAGLLDDTNAVIDRHEDEIGSLTTTISNTIDKLDNLQVGARNLILDTKVEQGIQVGINEKYEKEESFLVGDDGFGYANHTVTLLDADMSGWLFLYREIILDQIKPSTDYVLSFEAQSNVERSFRAKIQRTDSTNALHEDSGTDSTIPVSVEWTKVVARFRTKDSFDGIMIDGQVLYLSFGSLSESQSPWNIKIRKLKLEEGTVPTDWSPAPEDLESIADEALSVSTEVKQTAEEIRATADSAYSNANEALTQSSSAVLTANSIKTTLEQDYSTTDELEQHYASKSEMNQTASSIRSEVSATYATKSSLEALQNIADSAIQTWTGNGIPTLSKPPASDWTTTELKQQHSGDLYYDNETGYAFRFGSSDGVDFGWSRISDSDITKALADAAKAQETADGAVDEVEQLKIDIPGTYATKTEMTQSADSIRSEVSANYTTKETFDRLSGTSRNYITNPQFKTGNVDSVSNTMMNATDANAGTLPGTATTFGKNTNGWDNRAENVKIKFIKGHTYRIEIDAKNASDDPGTADGLALFFWFMTADNPNLTKNEYTSYDVPGIPAGTKEWTHLSYEYTIPEDESRRVVMRPAYRASPSSRWLVTNFNCYDVTDVNSASLLAQSAIDKSTTVEQDLAGFRVNVSETYTTKTEFENLDIGGTNLAENTGDLPGSAIHLIGSSGNVSTGTDDSVPSGQYVAAAFDSTSEKSNFYISSSSLGSVFSKIKQGEQFTVSCWMKLSSVSGIEDKNFAISCEPMYNIQYHRGQVSTSWTRCWLTGTRNSNTTTGVAIVFYPDTAYGSGKTVYVSSIKVERGNKPTAWSPAPEDIDSQFGDVMDIVNKNNSTVTSLVESSINQASDSIMQQVSGSYYTKSEAEQLLANITTQFTQTEDDFTFQFQQLQAQITDVSGDVTTNYNNIVKYIRFVDGNIIIGEEGNDFILRISNDRISFLQSNTEVAYLSNQKLYITNSDILGRLTIGAFSWYSRSNGNLTLRHTDN